VHVLERRQRLAQPAERAFAFYADALNLEAITPPWLAFRVTTAGPIEMRPGVLIEYRLRLHGVPVRWRTRIAAWEPPRRFVDVQLRLLELVRGTAEESFDRSIDVHVSRLRAKLGDSGKDWLKTIRGAGYQLVAPPA
jgi:hypothetical protein